jgi:hypothetical protein
MHPVHVWSHDEPSEHTVDPPWKANIAVIENRRTIENDLEDNDRHWCWTEENNSHALDDHRNYDLNGVKAETRRGV